MAPYLALKHGAASDEPIFFSVSEKAAMDMGNPAGNMRNNNCWATPQGWVLVRDAAAASTYLTNNPAAATRKTIQLPHLPADNLSTYCTCLLSDYYLDHHPDAPSSSQPSSSSSVLVLLVETDSPVIWYCRIGGGDDRRWEKLEYDIGTQDLSDLGDDGCGSEKLVICPIAACRGKFYFNAGGDEVGVLEFRPAPVFGSITVRDAVDEDAGLHKVFMVESGRELYRVSMLSYLDLETVHRVTVHRMDFAKREWSRVEQLGGGGGNGGRAFLLSSWYFGASCSAEKCWLEKNCVYMANPWEQCVRVYNVEDGTTEVLELEEAPETDQALWILPFTTDVQE